MARRFPLLVALALSTSCASPPPAPLPALELPAFRAPAIPLFVQTPYLNIWLCGDRLADEAPKLWNGQIKGMTGMIKIDGKAFRFMGLPTSTLPALTQDAVRILPTRTLFEFSQDDVRLRVEFLSPMDPRDLRLLSMPLGFLSAEVSASKPHAIQLYFDVTGEWAVGSSDRRITWDGLFRIRPSQPRLFHETYNYPDWGDVHWTAVDPATSQYGVHQDVRQAFLNGGSPTRDTRYPRAANDDWPVFAHHWDLGKVEKPVVRRAILGHVRREIVDYFGSACPAHWTRYYSDGTAMVAAAASEFEAIRARAAAIDTEVVQRAARAGGAPLACLAALLFRQSFAANELAEYQGQTFYFSKSMDISGVSALQSLDVLYPASSALLAFNPALLQMQLAPIFEALRRDDWRESHVMGDLGAYPVAGGPLSSTAPRAQSTAELTLLARMAGSDAPPRRFATSLSEAEPTLRTLLAAGTEAAPRLKKLLDGPRDQSRADFLVDRLLKLGMLPQGAVDRELAESRKKAGKYGAPFDGRKQVVHVDALLWTAALAPRPEREAIAAEVLRFYAETPTRIPAADQYEGETGRPAGTQARPIVGAVFAAFLLHAPAVER
jgi:hypothetical protein